MEKIDILWNLGHFANKSPRNSLKPPGHPHKAFKIHWIISSSLIYPWDLLKVPETLLNPQRGIRTNIRWDPIKFPLNLLKYPIQWSNRPETHRNPLKSPEISRNTLRPSEMVQNHTGNPPNAPRPFETPIKATLYLLISLGMPHETPWNAPTLSWESLKWPRDSQKHLRNSLRSPGLPLKPLWSPSYSQESFSILQPLI